MRTTDPTAAAEAAARSATRRSVVNGVALAIVVIATVYAAFASQVTSNKVQMQADARDRENACTSTVLFDTVKAINERTTYTTAQAQANVDLQAAQSEFIQVILDPKKPDSAGRAALERYFEALTKFNDLVSKSAGKADAFPYPTPEQYARCLRSAAAEDAN